MRTLALVLALLLAVASGAAEAQRARAPRPTLVVGYLGLEDDPRWQRWETYANLELREAMDPVDGARVAMRDARIVGRVLKVKFVLEVRRAKDLDGLRAAFEELTEGGARFFLLDLPAETLSAFVAPYRDREVVFLNVSAMEDELRGEKCQANVLHVIPSFRMLADALSQYLAHKGWHRILLLQGPDPQDARIAEVFTISARRFGNEVVEVRRFLPTRDPRAREQNNVRLLTTGVEYDVVFVADHRGEFGRRVPYATVLPRPVVSLPDHGPTIGLVPSAWHWASERFGSPQLNQRFERQVEHRRRMRDADFAAWAAVRQLLEAMMKAKRTDFAAVREALLAPDARLDVYKGVPANFRPWDRQMRQPIVLGTHNAVITYAPLPQFLHQRNVLDTLGVDEPNTACRL